MKRSVLSFLFVVLIFSLACAFFDDDLTLVTYEASAPIDFEIDADVLCPGNEDCSGAETTAANDTELIKIEFPLEIDVASVGSVDLSSFSGKFRSIKVKSIDYKAENNTLNFPIAPMDIYVAPLSTTTRSGAGAVLLATIPEIAAGDSTPGNTPVEAGPAAASSELFKGLKFTAIPHSAPKIKRGEPMPPKGTAEMKIKINLEFQVDPTDAL